MKPWVPTDKSKMSSVGAALTARVLGHLRCGCAAPTGLKECVSMPNPGLAPWAMNKYRPYRAPLRLPNPYTLLFTLLSVAAGATSSKFRRIMSAVGTTPLQSPGCNEGKARNETLGTHRQKQIELRRSGTPHALPETTNPIQQL